MDSKQRCWTAAVIALLCAAGLFTRYRARSVADLAEIPRAGLELRDVQIWRTCPAGDGAEDVRFYRQDAGLAEELAAFLTETECRYHHSYTSISYGHLMYDEDGNAVALGPQALYDLHIYGLDGDSLRLWEGISVLDDGSVYADGKCYFLKKEFGMDCITGRLEEILREYPEDAEVLAKGRQGAPDRE